MRICYFSADELNDLHIRAEDMWRVPAKQGWQKSSVDPMDILKLFRGIWVRKGYILRGYLYREGLSGSGVVWALKEGFPEVNECARLNGSLKTPKPRNALCVMDVLEGDGSPESYISASLFAREMNEFGALWYYLSWGWHEIIEECEIEKFQWSDDVKDMRPKVIMEEEIKTEFFTLCGLRRWRVYHHIDTFEGYRITSESRIVAEGEKGFVP